jgi:hypothetical protein
MADWTKGKMPVKNNGIYELLNNEEPASTGLIANERNATKDETKQSKRPTAKEGDDERVCLDVSLSDGNANGIDIDNPMPVYFTDSPSTEIEDFDVQSVLKNGGTANHDYVTGSEFRGLNVDCSSAGLAKFELQIETAPASGVYSTVMAKFNSVSSPNVTFEHKAPKAIASGVTIRVIKTNLDNQDTDIYSLINGKEV